MTDVQPAASTGMDQLDQLANQAFSGRVVRKDLVRQVKGGANVPVYVLEFLLGKYCASDDPAAIATGLEVVEQTLQEHFIRPDEAEAVKAEVKRKGQHRLIDKVDVRLLDSENKYWAHLANLGHRYVHIQEEHVYRYERLLRGGVWCQLDLAYETDQDDGLQRPFKIKALKPIQVASFDMAEYAAGRSAFSRDHWLDLVVRSIGLEPSEYDTRGKLLLVARLIPMAERNYNLIELGPWGTGKSFVYRETSPNAILVSGGRVTIAQLFVHMGTGRIGLLGLWDVVAFDEVAALDVPDLSVVNILKDYMESGSFARGRDEIPAEASIVFIGNTSRPAQELVRTAHLFADLPKTMVDPAFLDRLHFYLPGWEAPKLERRLFTGHYGFVSDYFAEALRQLRKQSHIRVVDDEFALGAHLSARDEKAVRKTVSGLLKILHPHGQWTRTELREYLEFALEGRRRVKEQLKKLAPHDYSKTAFSYADRDTGREYWVEVPEQPDELGDLEATTATELPAAERVPRRARRSTTELLTNGESATVEFKSSARVNLFTDRNDPAVALAVVKSVAGFMNANGGTLLIGVNDAGQVIGLDRDVKTVGRKDLDGYENTLTTLFERALGKPALARLSMTFEAFPDGQVCRIEVRRGDTPTYVRSKDDTDLYVRFGNSTRRLSVSDAVEYIRSHWPQGR